MLQLSLAQVQIALTMQQLSAGDANVATAGAVDELLVAELLPTAIDAATTALFLVGCPPPQDLAQQQAFYKRVPTAA